MEEFDRVDVGGEDSSKVGRCPICFSGVLRVGGEGASFELEQCVQVYFVFRHVLQMPPGEVEELMGRLWEDNLECWRGLCLSCADKVEECRAAYREMVLSRRRFEEVRWRTLMEGRKGLKQDGGEEEIWETNWRQPMSDIVEECKRRKRKRQIENGKLPVPEVRSLKSPTEAEEAEPVEDNYDPCEAEDLVKEEIPDEDDLTESEIKDEGDADSLFVPDVTIQVAEHDISDKQFDEDDTISLAENENIEESVSDEVDNSGSNASEGSSSDDDKEDSSSRSRSGEGEEDSDSSSSEEDSSDEEYPGKDSMKFSCDLSTCLDRGKKIDLKTFLGHYYHHDELIFKCSECFHLSSSVLANTCHWRSRHKELLSTHTEDSRYSIVPPVYPSVPWWCPECAALFSSDKARNEHLQQDHPDKTQSTHFLQSCSQCSRKYVSILELKLHQGTVHQMIQECSKCSKQFQSKSELMVHYKTDHPRSSGSLESLQCDDCSKMFESEDELVSHYESEHLPRKSSTYCTDCGGIFNSELLLIAHRRRIHRKDLLKCAHCPLEFVFKVGLAKHLMTSHSNSAKRRPRICPHCGKVFTEEKKLSKHIVFEHTARVNLGPDTPFQPPTVQCDLCLKSVAKDSLKAHWFQVHGVAEGYRLLCPEGNCSAIFFSRPNLRDHVVRCHSNASPQFSCAECGKSFFTKTKLSVHVKDVHAERPFKCTRCGKGFARKARLEKHHLHCGYPCGECDQVFTQEILLEQHKKKMHPKQKKRKPYVCRTVVCHICGKSLKSIHLSTHIKESHHIGNPDVFCDQCGKKLQNRRYLKVHMALVHNIGPPEMIRFPCTIEGCGKKLKTQEELDLHLKHHKAPGHKCKLCGKAFFSEQKLKKHVDAEHDREKRALSGGPHKCDQCGKGFALPRYLTRHLKLHLKV